MPEGPSLLILKENIKHFTGKKIIAASGYATINFDEIQNRKIVSIKTWGKHLFICLPKNNIEIHLRMFGSYTINKQKAHINPKLHLQFAKEELNFYVADVKLTPNISIYDSAADIMSNKWDTAAAKKKLKPIADRMICDTLADQQIFAGVGNIIKNEVLWRAKVHPETKVKDLAATEISSIIKHAVKYAFEFLQYKIAGTLSQYWNAYNQKKCSRCGNSIVKKYTGKGKRVSYFCTQCQVKK